MLLRCEALGKDKKKYCESNLNNIVVATGGTNQLGCIDCITNQHGYDMYYNRRVDLVFPVCMFFWQSRRPKRQMDKETLNRFKRDVFDDSDSSGNTHNKYFKTTTYIKRTHIIAYNNSTRHNASADVKSTVTTKPALQEARDTRVQVVVQYSKNRSSMRTTSMP